MGLSSLFQGQPNAPSTQTVQYPQWMTDYMQQVLGRASDVGNIPFTPYPGQMVAKPSDMTKEAWDLAQKNAGSWQPFLDKAQAATDQAAAPITSDSVSTFLNPYQRYITEGVDRNLKESVLPGIRDQFVSGGQFGSSQNREMASRAGRDANIAVGDAMAGNYQNALDSLLRSKDQQAQVGAQYGQLGTETQLLGANDASGIGSAGQQQDQISQANLDATHSEWMRGQMWPFMQLQAMEGAGQMPNWGGMSSQSWSPYQNGYGQSPMGGMMQMLPWLMMMKDGGAVDEAKPRRETYRDVKSMPRPVRRARGGALHTPRQRPAGALRMAG